MTNVPFAIHRDVIGKPYDTDAAMARTKEGWENRSIGNDRKLLDAYALDMGYMFTMVSLKSDWRAASNIKEIGGIGLDFDEGMTWQEAKADPVLGTAWLCYPSPSYTPDKPWKFRLIWRFPEPITDKEFVRLLLVKAMDVWTADPKCKDPARLWYGNPGSSPLFENTQAGFVPVDGINEAWDVWALMNPQGGHTRQRIEKLNRPTSVGSVSTYCPFIDGHYRDDIQVAKQLMEIIPPWGGRQSNTYQCADPLLAGMGCWLGEEVALQLMIEAGWIWHDSRGEMHEILHSRCSGFDENPFGVWIWMLEELVLNGGITTEQRSAFLQFKRREERGVS